MLKRAKPRRLPGVAKLEAVRREIMAMTPSARRRAKRRTAVTWLAAGLAAGGTFTYLFDPVEGGARRARLRARLASAGRGIGGGATRVGQRVASTVGGIRRRTVRLPDPELAGTGPQESTR